MEQGGGFSVPPPERKGFAPDIYEMSFLGVHFSVF
jgi:hypothetical protein